MLEKTVIQEIKTEIEVAELMVKDLKRLWNSYAKKALIAKQERELKQDKIGFLEYESVEELHDGFGFGDIDEDTYYRGVEYFESLKNPSKQSSVEEHRKNLKDLIKLWEGTIIALNEELNPTEKAQKENAFERRERELKEERNSNILLNELLG